MRGVLELEVDHRDRWSVADVPVEAVLVPPCRFFHTWLTQPSPFHHVLADPMPPLSGALVRECSGPSKLALRSRIPPRWKETKVMLFLRKSLLCLAATLMPSAAREPTP